MHYQSNLERKSIFLLDNNHKFEKYGTTKFFIEIKFIEHRLLTNKNDNIRKSEAKEIRWIDEYWQM